MLDMCSDVRPIASNISELTNNDNMCIYETALDKSSTKVDRLYTTASVMPMFRKGGKSDVSNYRPTILNLLYNHIAASSLLYKYQCRFLPGHSAVHHFIELIHHTCIATICHVFCDTSKAFDRTWHRS